MTLEELKVVITAQTSGLKKEMAQTKKEVADLEKSVSKSTKSINSSFKNMFKGVGFAFITGSLIKLGKQASNLASDLAEVQNVVDVAFGSMAQEVEDFSKSALKSYGLSELAAKRISSTFMSMGQGMGLASKAGKDMSLQLTGLVGDMASFYNVSSDVAETALKSVFTGETESLKKFGVVMTEANLSAFAMSQGIKKAYKDMNQAEKVMLRYNYVLKSTSLAQGDFARTGGSWANQVRIMKEQWQQLLGVMGKGLNQVLLPIVKALNNMLASAISVANALAKAFGWDGIENSSAKVEDSLTNGGSNLEGSIEDATGQAEKLARVVNGFDELNLLGDPNKSKDNNADNSGSTNATIDTESILNQKQFEQAESKWTKFLSDLKTEFEKWKATLPKLEINFNQEKAISDIKQIGSNLLQAVGNAGKLVIELAIRVANDLDIGRLGNSLLELGRAASELAKVFTEVLSPAILTFYEASGLNKLVAWIGDILYKAIKLAIEILDSWSKWFQENGDQINEFAQNLGEAVRPLTEMVILVGDAVWKTFSDTLTTINEKLQELVTDIIKLDAEDLRKILKGILIVLTAILALKLAKFIGDFITKVILGKGAVSSFSQLLGSLFTQVTQYGRNPFAVLGEQMAVPFQAAGGLVEETITKFSVFGQAMDGVTKTALTPFANFFMGLGNLILHPIASLQAFGETLMSFGSGLLSDILIILGDFGAFFTTTIPMAVSQAVAFISENGILGTAIAGLKALVSGVISVFSNLWEVILAHPFAALVVVIVSTVAAIINLIKNSQAFRDFLNEFYEKYIVPIIEGIKEKLNEFYEKHLKKFVERFRKVLFETKKDFGAFFEEFSLIIGTLVEALSPVLTLALGLFTTTFSAILSLLGTFLDVLGGILVFLVDVFNGDWKAAWEDIKSIFEDIWNGIGDFLKTVTDGMLETLKNFVSSVADAVRNIKNLWSEVPEKQEVKVTTNTKKGANVPKLAGGGVISRPTVAMMGEYSGASSNPEIVSPQSLMKETFEQSNSGVINAVMAMGNQVSKSIRDKDMNTYMDGIKVTKQVTMNQKKLSRYSSSSLVNT